MALLHLIAYLFVTVYANNVTVLVVGDSWGSLGPDWKELQDMFTRHGVNATVKSAAVGGTRACQWAENPNILKVEAQKLFPDISVGPNATGPDFLWYTLGGNDLEDQSYVACSSSAKSFAEQLACMETITKTITACSETMLDVYFKKYPASKVMQCGYDIPCLEGKCALESRDAYCGTNITCLNVATEYWQKPLLGPLEAKYPGKYTGLNILGTVQKAGGIPGAEVGKPVLDKGSPCDLMTACVHPKYGAAGATAVGEAFWDLYFSKHV
jgi:hypothetical protein